MPVYLYHVEYRGKGGTVGTAKVGARDMREARKNADAVKPPNANYATVLPIHVYRRLQGKRETTGD